MIHQRKQLAQQALFKALQVRKEGHLELSDPICIYDLVEQFGVEIRFVSIPSMEGVYLKSSRPIIILSSERPQVRQVYNCGHEFGHHVFNHGSRIDEFVEKKEMDRVFNPEEFLVECFSGFLLMPKMAVQNAFQVRNWAPNSATPVQIYTIAGLFGVGYSTLITHMQYSLRILNPSHAQKLNKIHPKQIKRELLGETTNSFFLVVDRIRSVNYTLTNSRRRIIF